MADEHSPTRLSTAVFLMNLIKSDLFTFNIKHGNIMQGKLILIF